MPYAFDVQLNITFMVHRSTFKLRQSLKWMHACMCKRNCITLLASVSSRWPVEVTNEYGSRLIWGRKRIWLAACLRSQMNMACGPSEFTTEYVPLQYVSSLVWCYNRIHPAAICLMAKYGSWLVWCYNRICPAAICLVACLRLQQNMSRCNMSRGSSEVTTEYVPLQYVSWLNMARGLSEVVT